MRRKIGMAGLMVVAWAATLALAKALLAPATGAAAVQQMNASDASYAASMSLLAMAPMATVVITGVFALVIYLIIRNEK